MTLIRDEHIGGGTVMRGFTKNGEWVKPGTKMTREELMALPRLNLQALVDTSKISLFPPAPGQIEGMGELIMVNRGFGRFDVLQGRRINDDPLTKDEAEALMAKIQAEAEPKLPGEEPPATDPAKEPAPN